MARDRLAVGRDVEGGAVAHAGERARGHVAHGAAACFAHRQADLVEALHRLGHAGQRHEVELHVLARGDVAEAARVFVGDVGEAIDLRRGEHALRDLHAQHVHVLLALAVGAAREAVDLELIGRQLARLEAAQMVDKVVDVCGAGEAERLGDRRHGSVVHDDQCPVRRSPGQGEILRILDRYSVQFTITRDC